MIYCTPGKYEIEISTEKKAKTANNTGKSKAEEVNKK